MNPSAPTDRIEIAPTAQPQEGTIIWLHGLGASGDDFVPIVPHLNLPQVRFIFPHAPERPVTINNGWIMRSWYDIQTLEESDERESAQDIEESHQRITALLDAEVERGLSPDQIILAGFSQGAAMALHTGLRYPASLRGIMALSGYLLLPQRFKAEAHPANAGTPLLLCHGTQDTVVPMTRGQKAAQELSKESPERDLQWRDYPMGHEVCPEEILEIQSWLGERFFGAHPA